VIEDIPDARVEPDVPIDTTDLPDPENDALERRLAQLEENYAAADPDSQDAAVLGEEIDQVQAQLAETRGGTKSEQGTLL
jgi:hypothetical protein